MGYIVKSIKKHISRTYIIVALVTAMVLIGSVLLVQGQTTKEENTREENKKAHTPATSTLSASKAVQREVEITGTLQVRKSAKVSAEVSGKVNFAPHESGSSVSRGATLVSLDDDLARVALSESEGQLESARIAKKQTNVKEQNSRKALEDAVERTEVVLSNVRKSALEPLFEGKNDLDDFGINISSGSTKYFISARTFADNTDIRSSVDQYQAAREKLLSASSSAVIERADHAEKTLLSMRSFLSQVSDVLNAYSNDDVQARTVRTSYAQPINSGRLQVANMLSELRKSRNSLQQARADDPQGQIKRAQASVASTKTRLKKKTVTAPFSGQVAEKYVEVGEFIQPGQPLYRLIDTSSWEVEVELADVYNQSLRVGTSVRVEFDGVAGTYNGEIISISPEVNDSNKRIQADVRVSNLPQAARSGLFARVFVPVSLPNADYKIPQKFISYGFDGPYITTTNNKRISVEVVYESEGGVFIAGKELQDGLIISAS